MDAVTVLCILCGCVAPLAARSVDAGDQSASAQDLEPFVAHHHHDGNIAELLIPLLERSLAQSEARSSERQQRRSKQGKKVIQMLPYRDSDELKRKSWRKLNSRKKQVVEITPLHGKNRAKPLAYILSAAKPSHAERAKPGDDVSSVSASDLGHDKSSSEEQQSSEEEQEALDTGDAIDSELRTMADASDALSSASSVAQSSENISSKESKVASASDKESSADTSKESVSVANSDDKSEASGRAVVIEENAEDTASTSKSATQHVQHHNHAHKLIAPVIAEDKDASMEDAAPVDNAGTNADKADVTAEGKVVSVDESGTLEDVATAEEAVTVEVVENAESKADASEEKAASVEDKAISGDEDATAAEKTAGDIEDISTVEKAANVEETASAEEKADASESKAEDKAVSAEEKVALVEENVIVEDTATPEEASNVEDSSVEDASHAEDKATSVENKASVEDAASVEKKATIAVESESPHKKPLEHTHHVHNEDLTAINKLLGNLKEVDEERDASTEHSHSELIENDIVISEARPDADSADKSFSKLFNARARDIIELIQSSVEASSARADCRADHDHDRDRDHDHKSYRLSFLFNK